MKHFFTLSLLLSSLTTFGQASVAYYPFRDVFSVSSNPNRALWLDARIQTFSYFGSLSTTLVPMVNLIRKPTVDYYAGLGVKFNALNTINNATILEGYSLHVGARVAPLPAVPNVRVAFELSPYSARNFKSGIFYAYLGIVYQFKKKNSQ